MDIIQELQKENAMLEEKVFKLEGLLDTIRRNMEDMSWIITEMKEK